MANQPSSEAVNVDESKHPDSPNTQRPEFSAADGTSANGWSLQPCGTRPPHHEDGQHGSHAHDGVWRVRIREKRT
jgi:hypothetical protein